jgi:hypothetical protein
LGLDQVVHIIGELTTKLPLLATRSLQPDIPLTRLQGIDIWTEERLQEEGIDSVQALATVPLERLVVRTPFSTERIVDWVDQALLQVHTAEDHPNPTGERSATRMGRLLQIGIRTASDLLGAKGCLIGQPGVRANNAIVKALSGSPENDNRTGLGYNQDWTDVLCQSLVPDPNLAYVLNFLLVRQAQALHVLVEGIDETAAPPPGISVIQQVPPATALSTLS